MNAGVGGSAAIAGGKISDHPAGRRLSGLLGGASYTHEMLKAARKTLQQYVELAPVTQDPGQVARERSRLADLGFHLKYYDARKYVQADLTHAWDLIADEITTTGARIFTRSCATSLTWSNGRYLIEVSSGEQTITVEARAVVIASGRLGDDLLAKSYISGFCVTNPPWVDVGVRLEFPEQAWTEMDLAHNDLKLHFNGARTFCASKGGWVAPYRLGDIMLLEGRSDIQSSSGLSNLAITVRLAIDARELLAELRRRLRAQSPGAPIRQSLPDYLENRAEFHKGRLPAASFNYWRWGDVNAVFPHDVADRIRESVGQFSERVLPRAASETATVFAPELDYYWSSVQVRPGFYAGPPGIWAIGDVVGQFRGILQAFSSGLVTAPSVCDYVTGVVANV